jgi:arylsulfatase A-like enzyme
MNGKVVARLLAGVLLGLCGAGCAHTAARGDRPNVIFILADDLGVGDVGCYGQTRIKTPNLDAVAAGGMRFTQAYAGSTVCAPSRCVLMTGKHTGHSHIRGNRELPTEGQTPMPKGTFTVAHMFQRAGYRTGIVGKWGLGYPGSQSTPTKMGFDYFFGYNCQRQAHSYYPDHLWRNDSMVPLDGQTYSHDLMANEALDFVRKNKDRPFFLYAAFTIPHAKLEVPDLAGYGGETWPEPEKKFASMITRMDRDIGRLMALLKELNLDDNTLVFFASDNGAMDGGDGHVPDFFKSSAGWRGVKRDLYEGGIRTPFIARWPGKIAAGSRSDVPTAFWDFMPTMAEVMGQKGPGDGDGISIVPALLGRPGQGGREYLYWEFYERGFKQAVRAGDWKAIRYGVKSPRTELYDLSKDPAEQTNLAGSRPEVVAKMQGYMKGARVESELWIPEDVKPATRPATRPAVRRGTRAG